MGALGGDLRGGQAQLNVSGHGLLQGVLRSAALQGMEVAVGDLLLRVIAAGVPWAKRVTRVRFIGSCWSSKP